MKKGIKPILVVPKSLVKLAKKFYGSAVDVYENKPVKVGKNEK